MQRIFKITQKHYDTILQQGKVNLPEESGGFLGGKDGLIQAILPMFNLHLYDKTDTFSFTPEDVIRAHEFFNKHNLEYYGLYHTHPKGIAYPSEADIKSKQQYHFILSLREEKKPVFAAFYIDKGEPLQIPFHVIPDKGFSSKDIFNKEKKESSSKESPSTENKDARTPEKEAEDLHKMIEDMKEDKEDIYPKMPPKDFEDSDFSTLA